MKKYIRAATISGLDEIAAANGYELRPLMARHGLSPGVFKSGDQEIPFLSALALLEDCARLWNMPDLGIQMANRQSLETMGAVALVIRMEKSVRDAVRAIIRNYFIHTNAMVGELIEKPGGHYAEIQLDVRSDGNGARQFREMELRRTKMDLQAIAGKPPKFVRASVPHGPSKGREILARELGCDVRYHARNCAVVFEADILDTPLLQTDIAFHPIIKRYLVDAAAEKQGDFAENVRLEIFRQLSLGDCTQDKVADAMRMQVRTLQRRLKAAGASFRDLLDEERRRKALSLVQQTQLPMYEVALALGYSDQTAFNQAFKRWYGRNPRSLRRSAAEIDQDSGDVGGN